MSKSVCHWRTGAVRRLRTATAAGGVGAARSKRVVDALRCIITSGRTIKRELEHSVELRPTRPVQTAFEIINYFKCKISEEIL